MYRMGCLRNVGGLTTLKRVSVLARPTEEIAYGLRRKVRVPRFDVLWAIHGGDFACHLGFMNIQISDSQIDDMRTVKPQSPP